MIPKIKISPYGYMVLVLITFWGTILAAMLTGTWITRVPAVPAEQQISTEQVETDIKGWMTFEEVSKHTHVSIDQLYTIAKLPTETKASTTLKDAANKYDFSVDDFKTDLASYMKKHSS
ncbi:hypothetical protein [Alicyclobacillus sp. SO9]|uniref:hypothetical protein n=1 Tax=Alicyclobacillus sp. SO9 TaxID=2665646 RepID=UPI0018E8401F|nr:hypothetical protein [Alicyclobacillus sp. SO9]QQE80271.1 hypothetical protein GI364_07535 [Alicyclobacillus sp. SO9]